MEGRFKFQALLDAQALLDKSTVLACMAYVDLNPIRAKRDKTPETSAHTSIKKRIEAHKNQQHQPNNFIPFICNPMPKGIAYHLKDYCELIDTTGRCIREDKTAATVLFRNVWA